MTWRVIVVVLSCPCNEVKVMCIVYCTANVFSATFCDADEKAELGLETSQVEGDDVEMDEDEEGRGKRQKL